MNMGTIYGDFTDVGYDKAIEICEQLNCGDVVVLDKRVAEKEYNMCNFEFAANGRLNFTYERHNDDILEEEVGSEHSFTVSVVDKGDASLRLVETGLWISWGMINYKETALANSMDIKFEEMQKVEENNISGIEPKKLSQLKEENEELKAQVVELQKQVELMKQLLTLDAESIRGSIWTRGGYECVVIQADANEYLLIDMLSYNRYYNEKFRKETVVSSLIEKGWELVSKGGN